jgi:SAM-dependent methyltransferase
MKRCIQCRNLFDSQEWQCSRCEYSPKSINGYLAFAPEVVDHIQSYNPVLFAKLAKLEAKNFWFRSRNQLLIYALEQYFPKAKSFLEIGCGTGFVLQGIEKAFPQLTLSGSEIFSAGLEFASQRLSRTTLFQMDAREIPFSEQFDVIGAFDVLEHITDDRKVLEQMYQATKIGGGIIVTVPQHPWLWSQADEYAHHIRRYVKQDLVIKLAQSGFKVVKVTSFVSFLLPLMLVSRLKKQSKHKDFNPLTELEIGGFLNYILEKVLDIERFLIKLGISFSFGGSLLVIAHKQS